MEIFILLLIIGFVIFVFKKQKRIHIIEHHIPVIEQKIIGYKKKFSLMNKTESALFFELKNQIPKNYYIFPNMRLADIIETINNANYYEIKKRNHKIMPKHIDFVICDSTFKPIVAIELNGKSHNNYERMEKDEEKKEILKEANLPLVTIKVGDNFNETVSNIKTFLV